jgi:hypothetical protein
MKTMSIALAMSLGIGCAALPPRAERAADPVGAWEGYVAQRGQRAPAILQLSQWQSDWRGSLRLGDRARSLSDVRVTATSVHFELPGEAVFDGTIEGDSIHGSVAGDSQGEFELQRGTIVSPDVDGPYWLGP